VRAARLATVLAAGLLLAACGGADPGSDGRTGATGGTAQQPPAAKSHVQVDTAALRAQKKAARVEPCRPGTARNGLPDLTLPCLGGGPDVRLTGLKGPLVLNLFAQWCGPCRSEMPYYQRLHQEAGDRLSVVGVDYLDTRPSAALDLVRSTGVTYPLLADPDGLLRPGLKVRALPGVVLVDARGKVVDVEYRVVRSYAELRTLVQDRLGVRLPA